ncbi:MAG: AAA family ATPase, partial [Mycoplasma sp.]|nr:AAA family ATPase [Mycoplasma sp.]
MDSLILRELTINKFRILKNIKIFFSESYNEITGENGIGKSSILDAIRYMLTERDENGSKLLNVKTITLSNEFESPDIELIIRFQSKEISLKTKNEKWFINNIEQKNKTIYFSSLHEKLNNIKPDDLIFAINPNILKDNLSSAKDTKNKENIKELIVSIANTLSDENSQIISNNEFQDLIFEINGLKRQLSDIKKEIKEKNNSIEHFKKMRSEISNWEITNDVSDFDKLELELKNKKIEYENITSKIDK